MRLLHITPTYLPATRYGGPIQSVHGLCKGLAKRGHHVEVFTTNVDGSDDTKVELDQDVILDGVHIRYYPSRHLRRIYWSPKMSKALKSKISSFDIAHLHSIYLWPTSAAAWFARQYKIPYLVAPRGMLVRHLVSRKNFWLKSAWLQFFEKRNVEQAAGIHATSDLEAQELQKFNFQVPPIFNVPNGIDVVASQPTSGRTDFFKTLKLSDKPYLLFLGRLSWEKGIDLLIRAMEKIPKCYALFIAGNDENQYRKQLEILAGELGLSNQIVFLGPVKGSLKWNLFHHAALTVLPSHQENFGNVVLEAMRAGCPVVVSPHVGLASEVEASGAGLVVDNQPAILGKAIQQLLGNPTELALMKTIGPDVVRQRFSWDIVAKQMEEVYFQILNKRGR